MKAKTIRVNTTSRGVLVRQGTPGARAQRFASMDQAMAAVQTRANHRRRVLIDGHPTFINAWIHY